MVVEIFSKIPNNQLAALDLKQFAGDSAFNVAKFNQIYYVKPVRNIFQVSWSTNCCHIAVYLRINEKVDCYR